MASGFDSALNIGGVSQGSSSSFSLQMFSKPSIVLAHVAFKGAALAYYFLANWLSSSFIVQFLVILTLLSMDFWTVKNITGRLLVGLRWWNFVDDNGNNHWKFESAKDQSRFPVMDRRAFWFGLVLGPVLWLFFVTMAFFTFKWEWMIVALLGLGMTSANLYGYLRCRWADTNQFTSYLSKWAFLSMFLCHSRRVLLTDLIMSFNYISACIPTQDVEDTPLTRNIKTAFESTTADSGFTFKEVPKTKQDAKSPLTLTTTEPSMPEKGSTLPYAISAALMEKEITSASCSCKSYMKG